MKRCGIKATGRTFGSIKNQARYIETSWWNVDVNSSVSKKCKFLRNWKQGNTNKRSYLEATRKARKVVYYVKCKAERNRFAGACQGGNQKCEVFEISKGMIKVNQDNIDE